MNKLDYIWYDLTISIRHFLSFFSKNINSVLVAIATIVFFPIMLLITFIFVIFFFVFVLIESFINSFKK